MKKIFPELPGWTFELDEVSVGMYRVLGRDTFGNSVSETGIDLDAIVEVSREKALQINQKGDNQKGDGGN